MNEYIPDWVSPPGDTIIEIMEEKNIDEDNLMRLLNIDLRELDDLYYGRMRIDNNLALLLTNVLGGSLEFWINRDKQYLDGLERLKK
jgi:HTH-type transcriptional regulator/antitoxin HigA